MNSSTCQFKQAPSFIYGVMMLVFTLFFSTCVQAKKASLVTGDAFGHDPYRKVAQLGEYVAVTGGGLLGGRTDASSTVDLLHMTDNKFTFIKTLDFKRYYSYSRIVRIEDVIVFNERLIFTVRTDNDIYLSVAKIQNGTLELSRSSRLSRWTASDATLLPGSGNNLYMVDHNYSNLVVMQLTLGGDDLIREQSSRSFGTISQNFRSYKYIVATFADDAIEIISNDKGGKATFYHLSVGDEGELLQPIELVFDDAKAEYYDIKRQNSIVYLGCVNQGLQVALIEGSQLVLQQEVVDYRLEMLEWKGDKRLLGSSYDEVYLFDTSDSQHIKLLDTYHSTGFPRDLVVDGNRVLVSADWAGIYALHLNDDSFSEMGSYSQSGEVSDFTFNGDYLVSSALENALDVWELTDTGTEHKVRFESGQFIGSVEFADDKLLYHRDGYVVKHSFDALLSGADDSTAIGNTNAIGRDISITAIANGYLSRVHHQLNFFDADLVQLGEIAIDNANSVHPVLSYKNYVFVQIHSSPDKVIVYDVSDLSNVSLVNNIELKDGHTRGNMVAHNDILYVLEWGNPGYGVTLFDIADISDIKRLNSISLDAHFEAQSLYIYDDMLAVVGDKGRLYDISDDSAPVLLDENAYLTSNGTSIGQGKRMFNVARGSAGFIQTALINLAPSHEDTEVTTDEDIVADTRLMAQEPENDTVSYTILTAPEHGTLEIIDGNIARYTPVENYYGSDAATLEVKDVHGGSGEFSISYTVVPVNDSPVVLSTSLSGNEDEPLVADIVAEDVEGDALTFSLASEPEHGSASVTSGGQLTYQPASNFFGEDKLEVAVTDAFGASVSAEVIISVTGVNDAPVVTSTNFETNEDNVFSGQISASDVEGDAVVFALSEQVDTGSVSVQSDGSFVFTPEPDFNGEARFSVVATDSQSAYVVQVITIDVKPVDDAPVAEDESQTISFGGSYNGQMETTDVDGDTLIYSVITDVTHGTLTLSQDGKYTYVPDSGFSGTDSFTYESKDAAGNSAQATVTFTVQPKPIVEKAASGGGSLSAFILAFLACITARRRLKPAFF